MLRSEDTSEDASEDQGYEREERRAMDRESSFASSAPGGIFGGLAGKSKEKAGDSALVWSLSFLAQCSTSFQISSLNWSLLEQDACLRHLKRRAWNQQSPGACPDQNSISLPCYQALSG
jgi:hypothetical protein